MNNVTIVFTKRSWNPVSWLIRWALPVSRFKWARASHSMILVDGTVYQATMLHGVVKQPWAEAIQGQDIVCMRPFVVPDKAAGVSWVEAQVGKGYDWRGAFGVSLSPDRDWREDDSWFCHELSAGFLHACGRRVFDRFGHVTDTALLLVNRENK
jgi:hypothetical protein